MNKIIFALLMVILTSCYPEKGKDSKDIIENKYFKNSNTYVIECRGFPREGVTGRARIETAKEAALMNAQFYTKDMFDGSVDVVRNGTIDKYDIQDDYVVIHYIIKYKGLQKLIKK